MEIMIWFVLIGIAFGIVAIFLIALFNRIFEHFDNETDKDNSDSGDRSRPGVDDGGHDGADEA